MLEAQPPVFMVAHATFILYAMNQYLQTMFELFCMFILSIVKALHMLIKYLAKKSLKMVLLSILIPISTMFYLNILSKRTLFNGFDLLNFKLLSTLTPSVLKMQVSFLKKKSNIFGIVFSSQNILIINFNALVEPSFCIHE